MSVGRRAPYALAAVGGLVAAQACPPLDLAPAILFGLALLAHAVGTATSTRDAALRAFVWAAAGQLVVLRFVVTVVDRFTDLGPLGGGAALLLLAAAQSLGWAAAGAVAHALRHRAGVPAAPAFGVGVLAACVTPAVFPWTPAGLAAVHAPLIQLADVVGERGVSVLLALVAAFAASAVQPSHARRGAVAAALLLLAIEGYGVVRIATLPTADRTMRVALVDQEAAARTSPDREPDAVVLARLRALSARADDAGAELVVWPEAAYPFPLSRDVPAITGGSATPLSPAAQAPRLIGVQTGARGAHFNSAVLVEPDGTLSRPSDKVRLLAFGETVPLGGRLPIMRRVFANSSRTTPGRRVAPLLVPRKAGPPVRVATFICYEDLIPGFGRRVARAGRPQLLVNLTNDAWFRGTSAPALQTRLGAVRAVELRTAQVRAVNGAASTWVDAAGRVRAERAGGAPGVLMAEPELRAAGAAPTPYARLGDTPAWALAALVALASAARRAGTRRATMAPRPSAPAASGSAATTPSENACGVS